MGKQKSGNTDVDRSDLRAGEKAEADKREKLL